MQAIQIILLLEAIYGVAGVIFYFSSGLHKSISANNRKHSANKKTKYMSTDKVIHIGRLWQFFSQVGKINQIPHIQKTTKQERKSTEDSSNNLHE